MPKKIDKAVFEDFANKLDAGVDAAGDGFQVADMDEGIALATSLPGLINEFKKDKVSAALALAEAVSGKIVDDRNAAATE